jgi:Rrf2 family protein
MAMADLADQAKRAGSPDVVVPLSAVAERQRISLAYLEQLFVKLRRAGLVESERGRAGGYRLARAAPEITVAAIMRAVEEDVRMTRCEDGSATCLAGEPCLTHGLWHALGRHIEDFLGSVSLQDVVDDSVKPKAEAARALFSGGIV